MSVATATPLELAIDCLNQQVGPDAEDSHRLIAAKIRGLMIGYDARWRNAEWETLSIEEVFHLPIVNPNTGATSRTFTHAGKRDGTVRYAPTGQVMLLEHKTTSDDITDPDATYWRRLVIDSQVSQYMLANWQEERKLDGTLYDVVRKPDIRPKAIPKGDTRKRQKIGGKLVEITPEERQQNNIGTIEEIRQYGTYHGFDLSINPDSVIDGTTESPLLYSIRLAKETLENPDRYFQRRIVPRMDAEVVEFSGELWDVGKAILDARNNNAHYRNSDACNQYNSPCEYLGVCSGHDTIESDKWARSENSHSELPELSGDGGLSVITNSRVKCFQSCRRKAYYRYELGVVRKDEEHREALYFGTLMHLALAAWWEYFK